MIRSPLFCQQRHPESRASYQAPTTVEGRGAPRVFPIDTANELERRRAETLTKQLRAGAWVAIAIVLHLVATTVFFGAPTFPIDYWTRSGTVLVAIGMLRILSSPNPIIGPRLLGILSCILICIAPALAGAFGGDFEGNATLIALIALSAGALFPWGTSTQALVAAALFAILMTSRSLGADARGELAHIGFMNAVTAGLAISILLARRTASVFEAAVIENLAVRAAQDKIRQLNTGLESTVRERTEDLELALADHRSFTRAVSHDIRQPLRHVDGYLRIFEEERGAALDEKQRSLFDQVYAALRRAGRMIDSLLDLSRLGSGPVRRVPLNLTAIAERILDDLRATDPKREVSINLEQGLRAVADPDLVALLLRHLLGNAWKFTKNVGTPTIEVFSEPGGIFAVRDNGVGFDMEFATKMFEAFERLHSTEEFAGEGIGLTAAQRVVRHHGGRIWATGALGEGATFRFTLDASEDLPAT